jgi:predicted transcriptional regulator
MAKTTFLQIRCSPEDRERMARIADAEHLDVSTWARRTLLQAVERWEARRAPVLRVAEKDGAPYAARPRASKHGEKITGSSRKSAPRKG